jgi:hypothetical protein
MQDQTTTVQEIEVIRDDLVEKVFSMEEYILIYLESATGRDNKPNLRNGSR